jgi:hypothetical protein
MTHDPDDDLGDARSRQESRDARTMFERKRVGLASPEIAYLHRWIPIGNRQMSVGDLILVIVGSAMLLAVVGIKLFGVIR